jgi:hypothetical protein
LIYHYCCLAFEVITRQILEGMFEDFKKEFQEQMTDDLEYKL